MTTDPVLREFCQSPQTNLRYIVWKHTNPTWLDIFEFSQT